MEGRLVLKDCSIFRTDGRVRAQVAVVVEGDRITRVGPDALVPVLPGDWEVPCRGRLVVPGLVDCHTHLVGGQLVPVSGSFLLSSPRARFELQHRRALQLTVPEVEAITAWGVARALRSGVTMVAEHLQVPGAVEAGLEVQARVAERLGIRAIISHATHSVAEGAAPLEQLEANAAFAERRRAHPLVRGALGFYSSCTADDALLRRAGRLREELGVGAHFHLGESEDDLTATYSEYGRRIVPRLESFGLLGPSVVGSYAQAIDRSEADKLAKSRTLVALHPRVAECEPGGGILEAVLTHQPLLGLGTAGSGTLWQQLSTAFASALKLARVGRLLDPDGLMAQLLISGPAELCSMTFGVPSGTVEEGALADLAVHDLVPSTEAGDLTTHLLLQLGEAQVAWTVVGGRVVVREGQLLGCDQVELAREAALALEAVWRRG